MNPRSNAWFGCKRDLTDARDHMFAPRSIRLPASVDLRAHCPPVMDQKALGSCTAHGITGALRYEMISKGMPDVQLSRLQLYYDERALEGTIKSDAGAEIRDGIKSASHTGVGHEMLWPYAIKKFASKPSASVYKDAVKFTALEYQRVQVDVTALKTALASGHTPIIGVTLYDSFESDEVAKTGVVPMPKHGENVAGGHCMMIVAYGVHPGFFTVQNSWGSSWGDHGFCHIPEAYLGSTKLGSDYWIVMAEGAKVA